MDTEKILGLAAKISSAMKSEEPDAVERVYTGGLVESLPKETTFGDFFKVQEYQRTYQRAMKEHLTALAKKQLS